MKTLPVEQLSLMPMALIVVLIVGVVSLTAGVIVLIRLGRAGKLTKGKDILAGITVGLVGAAVMTGAFFAVQGYVTETNTTNVQNAAQQAGQTITDDEASKLVKESVIDTHGKTVLLSDEGNTYTITVYDAAANAAAQKAQDAKTQQQVQGTGGF